MRKRNTTTLRSTLGWSAVVGIAAGLSSCNTLVGIEEPRGKAIAAAGSNDGPVLSEPTALDGDTPDVALADGPGWSDRPVLPGPSDATSPDSLDALSPGDAASPDGEDPPDRDDPHLDSCSSEPDLDAGRDASTERPDQSAAACDVGETLCDNQCAFLADDSKNCGRCGLNCSATNAIASCEESECRRACSDDFLDCNDDLRRGQEGDGCEADIRNHVEHCGSCEPCEPLPGGVAICIEKECRSYVVALSASRAPDQQSGSADGGDTFSMPCAPGQVMTGILGTGRDTVFGLGVYCGSFKLIRTAKGFDATATQVPEGPKVGGFVDPPQPEFDLPCPKDTVMTSISGSTEHTVENIAEYVNTLSFSCSVVTFDADGQVTLTPSPEVQQIGTPSPDDTLFSLTCGPGEVVTGFTGRSGAWVDQLAITCRKLSAVLK